jgi:hypothetical protein
MTAGALKAMIEARGGLQTVAMEQKRCADAGADFFPGGAQCDINPTTKRLENCRMPPPGYTGKKWTCVPKGTPGAWKPGDILPGTGSGTGLAKKPGAGTILAVAGAGLLLMRLLRS